MLPEVQAQLDADPEMAKAVKEFMAMMHQAHHAVQTGQHKTMEDAVEAISGSRPMPIDTETGEVITDGAPLMHEQLKLGEDDE